jgi:hypothetical protein
LYEIPDSRPSSVTSMLVRVTPHDSPRWIGRFLARRGVEGHRRGLFASRDPHRLVVMINTLDIYWVDVRDPESWTAPERGFVEDALFDVERDQVIVSHYYDVQAIDARGSVVWTVTAEGYHSMRLVRLEGSTLHGIGDVVLETEPREFA